jgi:AraC family transcriptional activator of mtrCDE
MSLVVNGLKEPAMTVKVVAGSVGYRSVSVFRRVCTDRMGMTAGQWRGLAREREWRRFVCGIPHE